MISRRFMVGAPAAIGAAALSASGARAQTTPQSIRYAAVRFPTIDKPQRGEPPPLSRDETARACQWLHTNFGARFRALLPRNIPLALAYATVCHETAYAWVRAHPDAMSGYRTPPIDRLDAATVLARCVFDTSGDQLDPNTGEPVRGRTAFPRNRAAFEQRMGSAFTELLVSEGTLMRRDFHGWTPRPWLYKGYGLFQYDLQHVLSDRTFFEGREWYDVDRCIAKFIAEMAPRVDAHAGDFRLAAADYNGSLSKQRSGAINRDSWGRPQLTRWYGENVASFFMPRCEEWLQANG